MVALHSWISHPVMFAERVIRREVTREVRKKERPAERSKEDAVAWLSDGASSITVAAQDSVKRLSFLTMQLLSKQGACSAPSIKCCPAHN